VELRGGSCGFQRPALWFSEATVVVQRGDFFAGCADASLERHFGGNKYQRSAF
jgi:hypothetical protein